MNKTIYEFDVLSKLEKGNIVYLVDMATNTIQKVNDIPVGEYLKKMNEDTSSYIFYTDVEEDEK